ncbi:MAG: homoserine dehydrogenase [Anaerolineae bacterium]|nr:homoserine dehydrogenase [Anaerolineae bacterium]MDX9830779.1 homoserine dehydrogenase [Anaerolineae bacterium]
MTGGVRQVRVLLLGAGNVGRHFLGLLPATRERLKSRLGLALVPVGVADRSGAALSPEGLDPQQVVELKLKGLGMGAYPRWGQPGMSALEMVQEAGADLVLDASPGNLESGQPGLGCVEAALDRGLHVVMANKAPLVLAFPRLVARARERGVCLRYDATVAGGLPAVNLGERDLAAARIDRLEGVLNLTSNFILARMAEGLSYDEALAQAQAAGQAETDPRLDVEGWDAASKLVILANGALGQPATLADVAVEGILGLTPDVLRAALDRGRRYKAIAVAERGPDGYSLRVGPVALEAGHPLARLDGDQMAIVFETDISGVIAATIVERSPMPTASAMLRDVVEIYRED